MLSCVYAIGWILGVAFIYPWLDFLLIEQFCSWQEVLEVSYKKGGRGIKRLLPNKIYPKGNTDNVPPGKLVQFRRQILSLIFCPLPGLSFKQHQEEKP